MAVQKAGQPRIVRHFDSNLIGDKSRRPVKIKRGRMIKRAGMNEEPADWLGPGAGKRLLHEFSPKTTANRALDEAEEGDFRFALAAKIQFEKADYGTGFCDRIGLDARIGKQIGDRGIAVLQPLVPEPGSPDQAEQGKVASSVRPAQPLQDECIWRNRHIGLLPHRQIGNDRRNFAGRQFGRAI
jgi:hypothetical protein